MKRTPLLRALLFAALAGAIVLAVVYRDQIDVATLEAWIKDTGALGPAVFMLVYVIGTVLFLPGSVLTLAGGALFGPIAGTFYNLTGATLGATVAFIIARYLASDWVARKAGGRMKQLLDGVDAEGWKFVALVRLTALPLQPAQLCPGSAAHSSAELHSRLVPVHAARRPRVHLSLLRRTRNRGRWRGADSEGAAGARA